MMSKTVTLGELPCNANELRWRAPLAKLLLVLLFAGCTSATPPPRDAARPSAVLPGMVRVSQGAFIMGCAPHDQACRDAERPPREVWLDTFDIDRLEVTIAAYRRCVADGACVTEEMTHPSCLWATDVPDDLPINCVRWVDAAAYCGWVDKRLPSEAEWEKAARGTDGRIYPWGNEPPGPTRANLCDARCTPSWPAFPAVPWDDGYEGIAPVGSFPAGASPYGALDMVGNVEEWVHDRVQYDNLNNIRGVSGTALRNPSGPLRGRRRALRGTSYSLPMMGWERVSARNAEVPTSSDFKYGIRCAR